MVATAVLVAAAVFAAAAVTIVGVFALLDALGGGRAADPRAEDVVAARTASWKQTSAESRRAGDLVARVLPNSTLVATGHKDRCANGRHNWIVDDQWNLSCDHDLDTVLGFDRATFRSEALELHDALLADGWSAGELDLRGVVTEYWDARATLGNPSYTLNDLPAAEYERADTGVVMTVEWLDRPDLDDIDLVVGNPWGDVTVASKHIDSHTVRSVLSGGQRHVVAVRLTSNYWHR